LFFVLTIFFVLSSPVDVKARKELDLRSGDTVRVHQKIEEKGKTRIQTFEGLVLARKHGTEAGGTFTVRRVSSGVGVEKIFPLYSPMIDKIEIVKRATMRRAKLYFIREKVAREARRVLRRTVLVNKSSAPVVTGIEEDQTPIEAAAPTAEESAAAEQA
jgi:large subunit ribosomal protein L19